MNKRLKPTTNVMDKSVIALVAKQDAIKQKLGLSLGAFAQSDSSLPLYDETNMKYKEYERIENEANEYLLQNREIPSNIQEYLLNTMDERKQWHEYCRTHYRKPKGTLTDEEIDFIFI